jgi:hypothetical protein
MNGRGIGLAIAAAGVLLVTVGILFATGLLSWFGRLPGDIRIQREGFAFYAPITSMLIASAVLSLLAILVRRVF